MPACPCLGARGGGGFKCRGGGDWLSSCSPLLFGLFQGAYIASVAQKENPVKCIFRNSRSWLCAHSSSGHLCPVRPQTTVSPVERALSSPDLSAEDTEGQGG